MKRIILGVAVMLVAFALGVGVNRLLWPRSATNIPRPETAQVEIIKLAEPVPALPALPSTPESRIILDYNDVTFYPNGGYSFLGATPKEFLEIDSFVLEYSEFVDDQPVGFINLYTKDGDDYESNVAIFGSVNERRLIFLTAPNAEKGFEYFFDGEFIRRDFDEVNGLEKAVLRGTLIKMQHGKKVAERIVSFRIEHRGC